MADQAQTAQDTTQAEPQTPEQAPTIDNAAIMARMDELASGIQSLRETPQPEWQGGIGELGQHQPDPQGVPDGYGYDQQFDQQQGYQQDQYGQQYGQMDPRQAEQQALSDLQGYISQQIQQGVQGAVTPWIQQQKAHALEQKYPDLQDPKTAGEVVRSAQQHAERIGRADLGRDPEFVELVYLAQQARDRAAQETPADGEQDVHLEGGGAVPQQPEESVAERIVNAGGGSAAGGFSWT